MTEPGDALLLDALNAAAGRRVTGSGPSPALRDYAEALRGARRREREAPGCPTAVLRRVQGLYARERGRAAGTLLRLVFDSWRGVTPAVRGRRGPRTLRFEGPSAAIDVRIVEEGEGRRIQIAAEPARAGLVASVETGTSTRARRLPLGDEAVGQLSLPDAPRALRVTVREGRRAVLHTARIRLE